MKFVFFPGSPGKESDFSHIDNNYINEKSFKGLENDEKVNVVAYSFGCCKSLSFLIENSQRVEDVIWISPFLFIDKKPSAFIKFLLNFPIVGDTLLKKMAPKAIDKFITESAFPSSVPEDYKILGEEYKDINLLKKSIFEKNTERSKVKIDLMKIKNIKVLLIQGDGDEKNQVSEIKKYADFEEIEIKKSGHALPWTHRENLIKILKERGIL